MHRVTRFTLAFLLVPLLALLPHLAMAQEQLILDDSWQPDISFGGIVLATARDAQGRLLIGGNFTEVNGTPRPSLARFNTDGSLDQTFAGNIIINDGASTGLIRSIVMQGNNVLIGGNFDQVGAPGNLQTRRGIARLTSNGALDASFTPPESAGMLVNRLLRLSSGKILVGGALPSNGYGLVMRLNETTGVIDNTFQMYGITSAGTPTVRDMAEQANGSIVIAGNFTSVGGIPHYNVARLLANGEVDGNFNLLTDATVNRVLIEPDGSIVLAGSFTQVLDNEGNSYNARRLIRTRPNLAVDVEFTNSTGADSQIRWVERQIDGKLLIGGDFDNTYHGNDLLPRSKVARLQTNGQPDPGFDPPTIDNTVHTLSQQADGRVVVGGIFSTVDGTTANGLVRFVPAGPMTGAQAISAGGHHSCALKNGAAMCWGFNSSGQLGDGTQANRALPVAVSSLGSGVTAISAGTQHTCAIHNGTAKCWGAGGNGRLGNGATADSHTPISVSNLGTVIAISTGWKHTCAVKSDGTVWCWGWDQYGQLGNGAPNADSAVPVQVSSLSNVTAISAGDGHTCALTANNAVWCWGRDVVGQLGNDAPNTDSPVPVPVTGLGSGVQAISAGGDHACALTISGTVKCWGYNAFGQLGINNTLNSLIPATVIGLTGVTAISGGLEHTCAVIANSVARCWGHNEDGQLGDGTQGTNRMIPVSVLDNTDGEALTGVTAISAGYDHTCGIHNGTVKCWGENDNGQLGDATDIGRLNPVPVLVPLPPPSLDIFQNGFE